MIRMEIIAVLLLTALVFSTGCLDMVGDKPKTGKTPDIAVNLVQNKPLGDIKGLQIPDKPSTSEQPPALPEDEGIPAPPSGGSGQGRLPLFG